MHASVCQGNAAKKHNAPLQDMLLHTWSNGHT